MNIWRYDSIMNHYDNGDYQDFVNMITKNGGALDFIYDSMTYIHSGDLDLEYCYAMIKKYFELISFETT